ncbi:hypothetical protein TrVE_jg13377 [Triparma verrucosa]|uniref:BspA family leucine-rich repeat surface protein n=2 Tax=Triparma TaxID=722752 RepID=A0A9W7B176_9STRA|nr:hypothetical protein TrST_g6992 [Triparma strigata]GMI04857.1 hypothetical protein TrVE_jg13377 [Triparma verrucosa]
MNPTTLSPAQAIRVVLRNQKITFTDTKEARPSRGSLYQKLVKTIDKRGDVLVGQQESSLVALRVLLVDRGLPFEDDDDEGKLLLSFLADLREARDKKKNLARLTSPVTTVFHGPFTNVTLRTAVEEWCQNRHAAEARYGKITSWDVSAVTDMTRLFSNSCYAGSSRPTTQSPKISSWDVSNVTSMREMFFENFYFTGGISNWNVENVEDFNSAFYKAVVFDDDLSSWRVNNVKDNIGMFYGCESFKGEKAPKWAN